MAELKYRVQGQKITENNKQYLVNQSRNYLQLRFSFTNDWKALDRYIIFNGAYKYKLTDNKITVPSVLLQSTEFSFSLYGVNSDDTVLITTENIIVKLRMSGYTNDTSTLSDNTPVDVITDLYYNKFDDFKLEDGYLVAYAKGNELVKISVQAILEEFIDFDKDLKEIMDKYYSQLGHKHTKTDITDFSHTHTIKDITDLYSLIVTSDDTQVQSGSTISIDAELKSFIGAEPNRTIYFYRLEADEV